MPFKISYTRDMTSYMVAAPSKENKDDEFYKRMNILAQKSDDDEIFDLMVQECEEYFDFDKRIEGFGELDYEEFNSYSDIEVDGKKIKMGKKWEEEEANHKSKYRDLHNQFRYDADWYVEYYVQWKSCWEVEIDEDKFDKKKLHWKDSKVWYGDIPIDEDVSGQRPVAEEITLNTLDGNSRSF